MSEAAEVRWRCPACAAPLDPKKAVWSNPGFPCVCSGCGRELHPQVLRWLTATLLSLLAGIAVGFLVAWSSLLLFDTGPWSVLLFASVAFGVFYSGLAHVLSAFTPSMECTSVPSKRAWWVGCLVLFVVLVGV